ncbi:hypothetical protein GA0111570_105139 [Raineyella antarctica]|uniref:SnoaL-like domain-containing protein n=1 Tax=Raineyella antarctica TaxID=1577474 RepID=A0A1G6GVD1_9ACTN|nr:Rv3235 family protein [Raineyella antarctica]SDB86000.1 hypothetical protein GA0111570_105139 [Raineyella antarctica]
MLTLLVPESRPPLIDLTGPYDGPPEPVWSADQPELFDAGPDLAPTRQETPRRVEALGAAGQACAAGLVDVLTGRRGPHQLARWTTEQVLADLVMLSRAVHRHPVRPVHPYVQVVGDSAAEIVVPCVPARGGWAPLRVLTARVEPYAGRWRCSHLGWIASPHRPDVRPR